MDDKAKDDELITHLRWARTEESSTFFIDEDRLRRIFLILVGTAAVLLGALGVGLFRLNRAALAPPVIVGIAQGLVFSGEARSLASVRDSDFDAQLADTIEVLFSRTEKGLPPEIHDFCAPEVVAQVDRSYSENALKYQAGYVQTMTVGESRVLESRPGYRRVQYQGLLSSRSASAAQVSPIYLDCVFVIQGRTPLNAAGWKLVHVNAIGSEAFHRAEREAETRKALNLSP